MLVKSFSAFSTVPVVGGGQVQVFTPNTR